MAIFTVYHYAGQLPITIALFHLQLNYVMILMQKLKIHQFYPFLSQNLKKNNKMYPKLANTTFLSIGKKIFIILCKLRNKASNLNAHLFKDYLIDESRCSYYGSESEGNVHIFS